jgi:GT2 family glycosyltransferase/2-polyprenyl-3-methyl-5-hydroxy-6-metoxy-1,4-benzoquinol methylase
MGDGEANALRYRREIEANASDSLSEIARRIPAGVTVLDLGTGTGALGRHLTSVGCTVDGVELSPERAAEARPWYRRLLEIHLETAVLADHFPATTYDVIVCADVLEHLRDPGRLLDQLPTLLRPAGRVLVSMPNVAYAGVIADLIAGNFEYRPTGLLDDTHVRFFTRRSLRALLEAHGFGVARLDPLTLELQHSEFKDRFLDRLPAPVVRAILAQPDALTYQFIVEAQPGAALSVDVPGEESAPEPRFACQLYWGRDGCFDERDSIRAGGVMDDTLQEVAFDVPPLDAPPTGLRLDPADRPGYIRLHRVRIADPDGRTVWTYDGPPAGLVSGTLHQLTLFSGPMGDCWLATGYDPHLELAVPSTVLARLTGGARVTVEMSAPISGDFVLATGLLDAHEQRWARERIALETQLAALEQDARKRLGDAETRLAALQSALEGARVESAALRAELAALVLRDQTERVRLRQDVDRLDQSVSTARNQVHAAHQQLYTLWARLALVEDAPGLRRALRRTWRALRRRRVFFEPHPARGVNAVVGTVGRWSSLGPDPSFDLFPAGGQFPTAWVMLDFECEPDADAVTRATLYVDRGAGYTQSSAMALPRPAEGHVRAIVPLPHVVHALRFDPIEQPGSFHMGTLSMREIGRLEVGIRVLLLRLLPLLRHPGGLPSALRALLAALRGRGLQGVKDWLARTDERQDHESYATWIERYDTLVPSDAAWIQDRVAEIPMRPRFSVLMPVWDTPEPWLRRAIESVIAQLYPDWELCIADDASKQPHVRRVLAEYAARDPRIKVVHRETNGHIAAASNSALALATGDFVTLLDHDDELAPHALYLMAEEIAAHRDVDLLYSDEDKIDVDGRRRDPYFKPDWSPDLLAAHNYFCHLGVYRTALVRRVGGFREGFEGSQDYDLVLRCVRETTDARIRHVPYVLYHWRTIEGSTASATAAKNYAESAGRRALAAHFAARDACISVEPGVLPTTYRVRWPLPDPLPPVSIIIPTRDGYAVLERCVESVLAKTTYRRFEIVIVDNQTRDARTIAYLDGLARTGRARVLPYDHPFNYSAINNFAAREAGGDVLCLLNNDMEIITPEWLDEMVAHAVRPEIGAVGAKLLYPNGSIQHAGVVTGICGVAAHVMKHLAGDAPGYQAFAQLTRDVSAVTGACLVVRRAVYEQVGGLDAERLAIAFNDIDFCLKVDAAGYRNVWTPHAVLFHHESYSRGLEDTPEKQARFRGEVECMQERWGDRLENDPYYNPNLSLISEGYELGWPPRASRPWRRESAVSAAA